MRATRAIIHTSNFRHNIEAVRQITGPEIKICVAVKADGYGHGAVGISEAAAELGADYLAVAAVCEAEDLRKNGITAPIIVLSPVLTEEIETLTALRLEALVSTSEDIKRMSDAVTDGTMSIHLKIDTGMGRIGCFAEDAVKLAAEIAGDRNLKLAGVCTHFPVSDSSAPEDIGYTKNQISIFSEAVQRIKNAGINPGIIHAANSGAILNYPESHFDMVRPGIIAYGYLPGGESGLVAGIKPEFKPRPVMSLESKLMHIKKVQAGTFISYGRKYKTLNETWIGTIPAGYADGYTRMLANRAKVLIGDRLYPVAGTVCMDQLMVDLGPDLEVNLYDRVVLFGSEPGAATAEDLTNITGTIPYELLCGISKRVPRIFD